MLRVRRDADKKLAELQGSECEMMLFYCLWQTHLWPGWMSWDKLHEDNHVSRQHKQAIQRINDGAGLTLHDEGRLFEEALQFAIGQIKLMGVDVQES